jgi:hypothetical protein
MNLYDLNPQFMSLLYDRIQLAARRGVDFWNDVPGGGFNRT